MEPAIGDSKFSTWVTPSSVSATWKRVREKGQLIRLERGRVLYEQRDRSDYFYLVLQGQVEFYIMRRDGSRLLLEIVGEGSVFGEGAAFDRQPRLVSAAAASDVTLVRFDPATIRALLTTDIEFSLSLLQLMSAKQRVLTRKLAQTTTPSATERIGELLLRMTTGGERGGVIRLTHDQIAAMVGVSRITVTRLLRHFSAKGAIETGHRQIRILDRTVLRKLRAAP